MWCKDGVFGASIGEPHSPCGIMHQLLDGGVDGGIGYVKSSFGALEGADHDGLSEALCQAGSNEDLYKFVYPSPDVLTIGQSVLLGAKVYTPAEGNAWFRPARVSVIRLAGHSPVLYLV